MNPPDVSGQRRPLLTSVAVSVLMLMLMLMQSLPSPLPPFLPCPPFPVPRLGPGSSLFDTEPPPLNVTTAGPRRFCNCQPGSRPASPKPQPSSASSSSSHSNATCWHHGNVRLSGIIPTRDVTAEYFGRPWNQGGDRHPPGRNFSSRGGASAVGRSHRHNFRRQSRNQADLEGAAYFFPEDHEAAAPGVVSPTWPTPSGMSEQQARALCQQAVVNSGLASGCRPLLAESLLAQAVSMCVGDLRLKDELSWLDATLPLLENECERRLAEKGRSQQAHQEAAALLRCPNMCSWNGQCSEWGCLCFPGFGSYDCSAISGRRSKAGENPFSAAV